jgi:PD-(D/E)XK nuclease superfamily protein
VDAGKEQCRRTRDAYVATASTVKEGEQVLVSVTELQDFLRCRRAWGFQSANAQSLVRKGLPNTAFHIGHAFHHGVEAQALGKDPIADTEQWLDQEAVRIVQEYQTVVGAPMSFEETKGMKDSRELSLALLRNYFDKWGWDNPIAPYEYVHPEVAFRIPIPETDGFLVGTIDGIAINPRTGRGVIVEHKTYADTPIETQYLKADAQLTGYWWAFWMLFGEPPEAVLWDGINKKLPKVPQLLKDGKGLSKQWISTTPQIYRATLEAYEFDEAPYADIISRLEAKNSGNETMFHNRREITITNEAVVAFGEYLPEIYRDMKAAQEDERKRYPNRAWSGCWDCWVRDLCDAQTFGNDLQFLIDHQYQVGTYGTQSNQRLYQPSEVGSLRDLADMHKKETSE